jgi:hypothetical protein
MEIVRRELIDWENVSMTLYAERELSEEEIARLHQLLENWPRERAQGSDRTDTWPAVMWLQELCNRKTFAFYWEKWFPEEWFDPLAQALAAEVPALHLLEIGQDYEPPFRDDEAFIHVPHKVVAFEDGSTVQVQPFEIARYTVSIAQFSRFVEATNYKTIAEQGNDEQTFRDNQFVSDVPMHKRDGLPAFYLSYLDAAAYCEWAKVRLPTEAEWLAAALIDDRIHDQSEVYRIYTELRSRPEALDIDWEEMTGTVVEGRLVVLRSGPRLVRSSEDLNRRHVRRRRSLKDFEDPVVFRVCK